jgi:hypothetical protein
MFIPATSISCKAMREAWLAQRAKAILDEFVFSQQLPLC